MSNRNREEWQSLDAKDEREDNFSVGKRSKVTARLVGNPLRQNGVQEWIGGARNTPTARVV